MSSKGSHIGTFLKRFWLALRILNSDWLSEKLEKKNSQEKFWLVLRKVGKKIQKSQQKLALRKVNKKGIYFWYSRVHLKNRHPYYQIFWLNNDTTKNKTPLLPLFFFVDKSKVLYFFCKTNIFFFFWKTSRLKFSQLAVLSISSFFSKFR